MCTLPTPPLYLPRPCSTRRTVLEEWSSLTVPHQSGLPLWMICCSCRFARLACLSDKHTPAEPERQQHQAKHARLQTLQTMYEMQTCQSMQSKKSVSNHQRLGVTLQASSRALCCTFLTQLLPQCASRKQHKKLTKCRLQTQKKQKHAKIVGCIKAQHPRVLAAETLDSLLAACRLQAQPAGPLWDALSIQAYSNAQTATTRSGLAATPKHDRQQSILGTHICRSEAKALAIRCPVTAVITVLQPSSNDTTYRPCMQC